MPSRRDGDIIEPAEKLVQPAEKDLFILGGQIGPVDFGFGLDFGL